MTQLALPLELPAPPRRGPVVIPVTGRQAGPLFVLPLPRWDTAWEQRVNRKGKVVRYRKVWGALTGNSRNGHWAQRATATREVIDAVSWTAKAAGIPSCEHLDVILVWAPGHNRTADSDNLWGLLKACCDALARGPRRDLPGLRLVQDDDPRWMTKNARIDRPPVSPGLWLEVTVRLPRPRQSHPEPT